MVRETQRRLHNALQSLTEEEQSVVTLFYIGTYRQKDIAVFLDISTDTVSNRLRSARAKLKERMLKMAGNALEEKAPSKDKSLSEHVMMFNACRAGELHLVKKLAAGDPSLIHSDRAQETPLAVAVRNGHRHIVEFLLDSGAMPEQLRITGGYGEATFGGGILEIASARGHHEVVSLVRDAWERQYSIKPKAAGLIDAVRDGDLDLAVTRIKSDPDSIHIRDETLNTALHWAVISFNDRPSDDPFAVLDLLTESGADLEATNAEGFTPLHFALWNSSYWTQQRGEWDLVRHLVDRGARVNINTAAAMGDLARVRGFLQQDADLAGFCDTNQKRPLSSATEFGHLAIAASLLKHGADPNAEEAKMCGGGYALYGAAFHGHKNCVELLLQNDADPNGTLDSAPSVCGAALGRGHRDIADLVESYGGTTDVIFRVNAGQVEKVREMLRVDPTLAQQILEANNDYSEEVSLSMLNLAFGYGADARRMSHWRLWRYRVIPLSLRLVFDRGADPNIRNHEGVPLLHSFVASGALSAAGIALEHGADVDSRDEGYQGTPLAWAARFGNKEMVSFLLERGARLVLPDDESWMTPLFWAERKGHGGIVEMLRKHEASGL